METNQEKVEKLEIQLEKLAPSKYGHLILILIILIIGFVWEAVELPLSGLAVGVLVLSSLAYVEQISHKRIKLLKNIMELKISEKTTDV